MCAHALAHTLVHTHTHKHTYTQPIKNNAKQYRHTIAKTMQIDAYYPFQQKLPDELILEVPSSSSSGTVHHSMESALGG